MRESINPLKFASQNKKNPSLFLNKIFLHGNNNLLDKDKKLVLSNSIALVAILEYLKIIIDLVSEFSTIRINQSMRVYGRRTKEMDLE